MPVGPQPNNRAADCVAAAPTSRKVRSLRQASATRAINEATVSGRPSRGKARTRLSNRARGKANNRAAGPTTGPGAGPATGSRAQQGQGQQQGGGQQPGGQPGQGGGQQGRQAGRRQAGGAGGRGGPENSPAGPAGPGAPITGEGFRQWSDRMRDVEELLDDPELRGEAARIRDRVRGAREEFKRHAKEPDWNQLKTSWPTRSASSASGSPRRSAAASRPTPSCRSIATPSRRSIAEGVRRYYERLGSGQ